MAKLLVLLMGLVIVAYLGYRSMYRQSAAALEASTPKQRLENAQRVADEIERKQQQAADEALKKSTPQE